MSYGGSRCLCSFFLLSQWAIWDKTWYTECKRWSFRFSSHRSSLSISLLAAAHKCYVWMMMVLSSVEYPQIPPCLEDVNHYLLPSLRDHLGRKEQDQLNETWSSPSRQFNQLTRQWCMLLLALMVFIMASPSLAETWKVACSKQFPLTKENTVCQNLQLMYITTLHLSFPKYPSLHLASILSPGKHHRGIFLIIWE